MKRFSLDKAEMMFSVQVVGCEGDKEFCWWCCPM